MARRLRTRCLRGLIGKVSAQRGLPCNSYSVNRKACRADLFAEHPVPLELEEERGGLWVYRNKTGYTSRLQSALAYRAFGGLLLHQQRDSTSEDMILEIITILSYR
ncbi:MAG: hypothetical protein OJF51_003949 [Nitrospira sp.]|jgi:hypothetical protein|nr:MAG: hypothetical protein OJF51_003949 [Nitrospira sp.]